MHNIGSVIRQKLQRGDSKPRKKKEAKHTKYLSRSIADGRLETVVLHLFGYKVFTIIHYVTREEQWLDRSMPKVNIA